MSMWQNGGLAAMAIGIVVVVITIAYGVQITAEIQQDIVINATENPEAAAAVASVFTAAYSGMTRMGTLIMLSIAGMIISVIGGFAYLVTRQ